MRAFDIPIWNIKFGGGGAGRGLFPAAAEGGVEGDDGLELLEVVVDAGELGGEEVLFGGEDVGVVGFGVGFHEFLCVVNGFLEEVDLVGAGLDLLCRRLVVEECVADFLPGSEQRFFEGQEELLFLALRDFEALAVEAVLEDGLGQAADDIAEEGRCVEEVGDVI